MQANCMFSCLLWLMQTFGRPIARPTLCMMLWRSSTCRAICNYPFKEKRRRFLHNRHAWASLNPEALLVFRDEQHAGINEKNVSLSVHLIPAEVVKGNQIFKRMKWLPGEAGLIYSWCQGLLLSSFADRQHTGYVWNIASSLLLMIELKTVGWVAGWAYIFVQVWVSSVAAQL